MPVHMIDDEMAPGADPKRAWAQRGDVRLSDLVRRAVDHLERNYTEPISLRDLEAVTTSNAYRIIRAFRRDLATTPHAFLMQLRVRRATMLLVAGESIIGAAAEAGFADQSHFTRHFKRLHGMTPGEFLRRRQTGDRQRRAA